MVRTVTDGVVDAVRNYLGPEGIDLFRFYKQRYGSVSPVFPEEMGFLRVPHPVHFREGMQIRNFIRKTGLCPDWTQHDLDDTWALVVEEAIK